jgi:hypothetical protein
MNYFRMVVHSEAIFGAAPPHPQSDTEHYRLLFVPHLPPVAFEVKARNLKEATRRAERQIAAGKGPVFEQVKRLLYAELLTSTQGRPTLCSCPSSSSPLPPLKTL